MSQSEDNRSLASEFEESMQFGGDSLTVDQQNREMEQMMIMANMEECSSMNEMPKERRSKISKICIDIWRDVFDWISPAADRKQLSRKFEQFGDRDFSHICQKWLHEWTKDVCMGKFWIDPKYDKSATLRCSGLEELPFAEAELPANICDFEGIRISYFDSTVLQFLRQLQPLFRNSNLFVECDNQEALAAARISCDHLLPLLSAGIENVRLHFNSSQFLFTIRDHFPAQFFAIRRLFMENKSFDNIGSIVDLLLAWLSTPHADGQARMLEIYSDVDYNLATGIVHLVRQHFNGATKPVSFFINILPSDNGIQESIIQNVGTKEQLVVQKSLDWLFLHIGRCSSELNGQTWIEEMNEICFEAWKQETRIISVEHPTLGVIEEEKTEEEINEKKDANHPGPSSKNHKYKFQ